ncbi:hypothetical protein AVEN_191020-1 [Araneus ventricosus]|uniref:Uncharacterized protein n=1 Tax=Araneus ventricosus TaxID=182803 RepID=A0A4Y1ZWS1_ARAVE|nr:hypothetical protein AVEN_191020-1 [Araneus ventricosus]
MVTDGTDQREVCLFVCAHVNPITQKCNELEVKFVAWFHLSEFCICVKFLTKPINGLSVCLRVYLNSMPQKSSKLEGKVCITPPSFFRISVIEEVAFINPLTPKPAVTGHTTSILVGRISAGCCSEWEEKAVEGVVIKGPLWVEIGDKRHAIHISHHPGEKMKRDGQIHFTIN